MTIYVAADDVLEPDWAPLEAVCALTAARADVPTLELDDFMYMWRFETLQGAALHLYKHIDSRRYLNLDDAGHAYQYLGEARARAGGRAATRYRPHNDLRAAIDRLGLRTVR